MNWASQIPFLHNIKKSVPPSEACLYGCISWSLAQFHQPSLFELSQFSTSMRGARAKPKAGFEFNVQKQPVAVSGGASLAKKPQLDAKSDSHQGRRKSAGGASTRYTETRKKDHRGWHC